MKEGFSLVGRTDAMLNVKSFHYQIGCKWDCVIKKILHKVYYF